MVVIMISLHQGCKHEWNEFPTFKKARWIGIPLQQPIRGRLRGTRTEWRLKCTEGAGILPGTPPRTTLVDQTDSLSPTQGCRSLLWRCAHRTGGLCPIQAGEEAWELTWYWMWSGQGPLEPARQLRLSSLSQLPGGTKSNPWKILGFQIKKANHVEQARSLQQTANWLVSVKNIEPVGIRKHWPEAHLLGFWGNLLRVHCTFHSHPPPTPPPWTHSFFLLGRNLSSVEGEVAEESQNLVSPLAKLQICPVSPVRLVFTWETLFSELCVLGVKDKRWDKSHSTGDWDCLHSLNSVQSLSRVRLFVTPWTAACQAFLSITNSRSLLKLMSIESVMPSNRLILCRPLLLSIFPSIRVFSNKPALHIRWPKYWSFNFNISPSNEYSGLISIKMNWLDFLAVQGTLKESSPTPQFRPINSLVLNFPYSPTLTSILDYRKNQSLD